MAAIKLPLTPKYIFGINTRINNHLHFLDNQTVIYPAGNYLVLHNIETATQRFIPIIQQESVLCGEIQVKAATRFMALVQENEEKARKEQQIPKQYSINLMKPSSDKRLIALAHFIDKRITETEDSGEAMVQIIDIRKMRQATILRTPEQAKLKALEFSNDSKYLFGLTDGPEYKLYVWNLDKSKLAAEFSISDIAKRKDKNHSDENDEISIGGIAINPIQIFGHQKAFYQICIYGKRLFRLVKYVPDLPSPFKVLGSRSTHYKNYVCHEWLSDGRVLLGTDDGGLIVCDMMEAKTEIRFAVPDQLPCLMSSTKDDSTELAENSHQIECCRIMNSKTIFIGTRNGFILSLEPSKNGFKLGNMWNVLKMYRFEKMNRSARLLSIALSPSDDALVCTMEDHQIFLVNFGGRYEIGQELDTKKQDSLYALRHLHSPFHEDQILDLELSTTTSTLITCSADKSIKFWDLSSNEVILHKEFDDDEPVSVSLHVSNFFLLVAFKFSIKLFQIVDSSLHQIWSIPAVDARFCKFSNGGQFFMAAFDGVLNIYSTWFHTRVGMVGSDSVYNENVYWRSDDKAIITVERTGNICEWAIPYEAFEEPHIHDPTGLARRGASRKRILFDNPTDSPGKPAFRECLIKDQTKNEAYLKGFVTALPVKQDTTMIQHSEAETPTNLTISRSLQKIILVPGKDMVGFSPNGSAIYIGSNNGSDEDAIEVAAHTATVTIAKICSCLPLLVSASADKSMIVFSLRSKSIPKSEIDPISYALQDILVPKEKYITLSDAVQKMTAREKELQEQCLKDQAFREKQLHSQFDDATDRQMQECRPVLAENECLIRELKELRLQNVRHFENVCKDNQETLRVLKKEQELHLDGQRRRYEQMQASMASKQAEHLRRTAELRYFEQSEIAAIEEQGKLRLDKKKEEIENLKTAISKKQQELYCFETEVNEQIESEILELTDLFERELRKEIAQNKVHITSSEQLTVEHAALLRQSACAVQEKDGYHKMVEELEVVVHNLKQDLMNLNAELKQRHQTELDKDEQIEQLNREIHDAFKLRYLMQRKFDAETKLMAPRKAVYDALRSQTDGMRQECVDQSKALKDSRRTYAESRRKLIIFEKNVNRDRLKLYGFAVFMKCMMSDLVRLVSDESEQDNKRWVTDFYQRYVQFESNSSFSSAKPKGYVTEMQVSVEIEDAVMRTINNLPLLIDVNTVEFSENGTIVSMDIVDKITGLITDKISYQDFKKDSNRHRQYFDCSVNTIKDRMVKGNGRVMQERYKMIKERYETLNEMAEIKRHSGERAKL